MDRTTKHNKAMAKQKAAVDGIAKADTERGVSVLLRRWQGKNQLGLWDGHTGTWL